MPHDRPNGHERAVRDAVLAGDSAAWRGWYASYFDRVARYARWRCGGRADLADEVIQEAWLTAIRRLKSFDPSRGTFFDWLRGIAANAVRNALRARQRQQKRTRQLVPADDACAPEPDSIATDQAEHVATALAELPEHYEAVLRAKYLDQLPVNAIADERGETPKAVESLLTRARQAFREAYEKANHA